MDIENSILSDRSNENIWKIAHYLLNNPEKLETLWELIENGSKQMEMRASWALGKVIEKDATLLDGLLGRLLTKLDLTENDGLKRNLLRSIYFSNIKKEDFSVLFDLGCKFVLNPNNPVAVRMFSMRIAHRVVKAVPDLCSEYLQVLESIAGTITTSGLKSSYSKVLKSTKSLQSNIAT